MVNDILEQGRDLIGDARIEHLTGLRGTVFDHAPLIIEDAVNEHRFRARAAISESGIAGCHFHRGHIVSAQGDGRSRLDIIVETKLAGHIHDAAIANHLGYFHGGDVERIGEGVAQRDGAMETFAVVIRRVVLAFEFERGGLIHDGAHRSDCGLDTLQNIVKGCGVDEGLENGAGLTPGGDVVELAFPIVAAADRRKDVSGMRIDGKHGDLGLSRMAFLFPLRILAGEQLIHVADSQRHRLNGGALELRIKRGVHAETLGEQLRFGEAVEEMIFDHIHEIRRVIIILAAGNQAERSEFGFLNLLRLDEAVFLHLVQDAIAGFGGAFGATIGSGVAIGSANNSGEERSLRQGNVADVFIEIGKRAFGKAVNGEAAAIAEVNLVGVELENLLLIEAMLEFDGDDGLGQLTAPSAFGGKEEAARELHGEGAGALSDAFAAEIGLGGSEDTDEIETGMLEKALVLCGEDRFHQHFGDVVETNPTALLARCIEEIGEQLRLDLRALDNVSVVEQGDAAHAATCEIDVQGVLAFEVGIAQRMDLDDITLDAIPTGSPVDFRLVIAVVLQLADQLGRGENLAVEDTIRGAIDAGARLKHVAGEVLINHAAEGKPVVGEDAGKD